MDLTGGNISSFTKMAQTICNSCESPSKYRCPKCLIRSCSLSCVKKHKVESSCDGIRDKTAYVRLSEFTEKHLLNDYRFLEEADRIASRKRRFDPHRAEQNQYRIKVSRLRDAAKRRNINLMLPPMLTTSQTSNSTNCIYARNMPLKSILQWHIEWKFSGSTAVMKSVDETLTMQTLLDVILNKTLDSESEEPGEICGDVEGLKQQFAESSPSFRQLILSQTNSRSQELLLHLVKRGERTSYKKMDKSLSLSDNLRGETVFEHPVILICFGDEFLENQETGEEETSEGSSDTRSGDSPNSESEPDITGNEEPK